MIIIADTKYLCIECIRGHRSSQCYHHFRPLLQVRSKGRPAVHPNGNPNHRIAVFAEEIYEDDEPEVEASGPCKNRQVIVLKASEKQVFDLKSKKILGAYNEVEFKTPTPKPTPIIDGDSFVNRSSCCSNGASKITKLCGCNKKVDKSKILNTYFTKKRLYQFVPVKVEKSGAENTEVKKELPSISDGISNGSSLSGSTIPSNGSTEHSNGPTFTLFELNKPTDLPNSASTSSPKLFDVFSVPSCSIPGSCCCGDNCSCEGCIVHGNTTQMPVFDAGPAFFNNTTFNNQQFSSVAVANRDFTPEPAFFDQEDACKCPPDNCNCTNCEAHGIINGVKLDDFFSSGFGDDFERRYNELSESVKSETSEKSEKNVKKCCK